MSGKNENGRVSTESANRLPALDIADMFESAVPKGIRRLASDLNLSETEIVKAALVRGLASIDREQDRAAVMRESARPVHWINVYLANGHAERESSP